MAPHVIVLVIVGAAVLDLIAWAAFRFDKARARGQRRRIRERTLLALAIPGGLGAALAMYAHRQRHKTTKPLFVVVVTVAALAQVAALAYLAYLGAAR